MRRRASAPSSLLRSRRRPARSGHDDQPSQAPPALRCATFPPCCGALHLGSAVPNRGERARTTTSPSGCPADKNGGRRHRVDDLRQRARSGAQAPGTATIAPEITTDAATASFTQPSLAYRCPVPQGSRSDCEGIPATAHRALARRTGQSRTGPPPGRPARMMATVLGWRVPRPIRLNRSP